MLPRTVRTTVSVVAMPVFGTVNEKYVPTTAVAVNTVIDPVELAPVVGVVVVRLVNCVTATPAPVAYPIPPVPVDRTLVDAVTVVNAPVDGVVAPTVPFKAAAVIVGPVPRTTAPLPVLVVTPVPPFPTAKVPETSDVRLTALKVGAPEGFP